MKQSVHDFLDRSPVAQSAAQLDLGKGCRVSIWENSIDKVSYIAPVKHTFSLYLKGGMGTRRTDIDSHAGYPGAICVMPEGCGSDWEITQPFRFVHLYVTDTRLRSGFARTHDCDARRLSLDEATFVDNPRLAAPLSQLAGATIAGDALRAQTAMAELFAALDHKTVWVRSGLSARVLRRVDDWIEAHLDGAIALEDLADLAGLSSYHFHRMFRLSRGIAPHAWVMECRLIRARRLLGTDRPIADIAVRCGFSSQSHLTRAFRDHIGLTPGQYRALATA